MSIIKSIQRKTFDNNTYTYNANGIRTSKTVGGIKHTYTLDGTKILREIWNGNELVPMYDNEESVCGIFYNGTPYYFQKNLQGDIIGITDQNGAVKARYSYDAWGVCTIAQDHSEIGIATINPYRYRGYYFDEEMGFYYVFSRYYDSVIGRFLNADILIDNRSVLDINLYTYCWNSAENNYDSTGYYTTPLVLRDSIITLMSGALTGIMTSISASMASIKVAIATSWFIPVCIAATAIAIVGIIYAVNKVMALSISAATTISAVKANIKKGGVRPGGGHTVYVIARKGTYDVVYVGRTCNFTKRQLAHQKRFPKTQYTMYAVKTGLSLRQARALEQSIITGYSIDTLKNMINSISPKKWGTFKEEFAQMGTLIQSWIDPE